MKIVYIDAQNVHRCVQDAWWLIDRSKFYSYIKEKCSPDVIYYAVWYIKTNQAFYDQLQEIWFTMLYKETIILPNWKVKWNVDIDIAIRTVSDVYEAWLQVAHFVTNDWDYNTLIQYCKDRELLWYMIFPYASHASRLLTKYTHRIIDMQRIRHIVEKQKDLAIEA